MSSGGELARLGKFTAKVGSGSTPRGGKRAYVPSGIPFIRSQNILSGEFATQGLAYITEAQHARMQNSSVKPNDVLLNITGASIGRACVLPSYISEANVNQHVCIIRPTSELNPVFLCEYLNSTHGQRQIMTLQAGGNRQGINFEQIRALSIPSLPRAEQDKIVETANSWSSVIGALEASLSRKRERKRGLMQVLLTGKKRFKEFHGLPRPEVDLDSQLERIIGGGTPSRSNPAFWEPGGIPWITVKDLRQELITGAQEHISELGLEMSSANLVPADTVIVATRMAVGKSIRCAVPAAINQDLKALFPRQSLHPHYLHLVLQSAQPQLEALASGSTVKGIRLSDLRGLRFDLPPLAEQQTIASVFSTADAEIEILEQQLEAYKLQKRGLMQQLLTGKKRVKVDDLEAVA